MSTTSVLSAERAEGEPSRPSRRDRAVEVMSVVALAAAAALLAWVARRAVFPAYSWNRDEPVYLWHVDTLRGGHFMAPDGGRPQFFAPWLTAARPGRFFSQYTLGWPLVLLAADVVFGTPTAALGFASALLVSGTYVFTRALVRDHTTALIAAGLMLLSPILVVQGGVYLGYVFSAGLGLWFGAALVEGIRQGRAWLLLAAGAFLGAITLTRPLDAVLWLLAIATPVAISQRRDVRRLLRCAGWVVAATVPFVIAALAYNRHVSGSLTTFPFTAKDPLDNYGFGRHRLMPGMPSMQYGVVEAIKGTLRNGFNFFFFVAGGFLVLPVALFAIWHRRRESWIAPVVALLVVFPAGYFFFWGTNISSATSRISGPIYFVPMYAPLCLLVAVLIAELARVRRGAAVMLAVVLVVAGLPFAVGRIVSNHRISVAQLPWKRVDAQLRAQPEPALAFVGQSSPYLMLLDPFSVNRPALDGRVLYAVDLGPNDIELIESTPDRRPYLVQPNYRGEELQPSEHPKTPVVAVVPLSIVRAKALAVRASIVNPTDERIVTVSVIAEGKRVTRTLSTTARRGARLEFSWLLSRGPTTGDGTTLRSGYGSFELEVRFGPPPDRAGAVVRRVVPYRLEQGKLAALVPARAERLARTRQPVLQWRPAPTLPELELALTPA